MVIVKRFLAATGTFVVLSGAACLASSAMLVPPARAAAAPADDAAGARLVSQIAARLGTAKGIRARFSQTQTLAAMKAPLVSTGTLLFMRERGVIWQIETPYRATYVIGDAGVVEIDAAGKRVARGTRSAGGVAQVSRMMRAMLGADLSALYSQFDVAASGTPSQWRMQLTPNQPQLAQALKGLRMAGGDYLQTLTITAANGDTTRLDFTNSTSVDEPTPAERALFGGP